MRMIHLDNITQRAQCKRNRWEEVRDGYMSLVRSENAEMRRTLSFSLHEVCIEIMSSSLKNLHLKMSALLF